MNHRITLTKHNSNILNIIRIIAIWSVLLGHLFSYYQVTVLKDQTYFPFIQNIGVVLLFILSGFLTAFSMNRKTDNNENYDFKTFFSERTSRIYSAFLPALVFVFLVDRLNILLNGSKYIFLSSLKPITFLGNVFMLQDFPFISRWITSFGSGRPFWTLAIEWWAYMVFGYVVLVIYKGWKKASIKWYEVVVLLLLCFEPILKIVGGRGNGLMLTWLLGVSIYLIYKKINVASGQIAIIRLLTCVSILVTGITALWFRDAYNTTFVFSLSVSILFILICGNMKESGKEFRLVTLLSCYMYSLYLVHYSIVDIIYRTDLPLTTPAKILVSIIVSNLIAILFYFLFEKRSKYLGDHLMKWMTICSKAGKKDHHTASEHEGKST
jgi:peptidoglycan/LPS O-acetylase OafA/YrhL